MVVKLSPVLVANLCLEAMKDLKVYRVELSSCLQTVQRSYILKHFMKIALWTAPRRGGIAEENEIRNHTSRVDCDHLAHSTER